MENPVVKGTAYSLIHVPDMMVNHGSEQISIRNKNPEDEYITNLKKSVRDFDAFIAYPPNQCYVGNIKPEALRDIEQPWFNVKNKSERIGKFGGIYCQDELYLLMKYVDTFELVKLSRSFLEKSKKLWSDNKVLGKLSFDWDDAVDDDEIETLVSAGTAEVLMSDGKIIGCVKGAHDEDENLNAHIILENLTCKASAVVAALDLAATQDIDLDKIEYIIECSEEACGDVNQRGGGNFAKAIGEVLGCTNSSGSDLRSFCAAPAHAMISAAALVKAGIYNNVLVVAGGSVAKLGMNGKKHVSKGMPVLEDCLGAFAFLVSENDGDNPEINLDMIGRHKIGTGSSPQAVMSSLITDPLQEAGMTISDINKYSLEMQNPEITKPAGAGDVAEANYKMIAALGVMKNQIEKAEMLDFIKKHGMPGFAPTQGHIPSGVPFLGHAREMILNKEISNAMIVGKGSLFLGRMTNLFDGISFVLETNKKGAGSSEEKGGSTVSEEAIVRKTVAEAMRLVSEQLAGESRSK